MEVVEQGGFEVGFEVAGFFGEAGEFEHVGVADEGGDVGRGVGGLLAGLFDDRVFVGGEAGAFIEDDGVKPLAAGGADLCAYGLPFGKYFTLGSPLKSASWVQRVAWWARAVA